MKALIIALFTIALIVPANASIWVKSYIKDDGTIVESYQRSTPSEPMDIHGNWKHSRFIDD